MRLLIAVALVLCAAPGIVAPVSAQPGTASLSGRILDPQGATAEAATVTLRSRSTAATWITASDAEGRFRFSMLPPGSYYLEADLTGFNRRATDDITLQVGQDHVLDVQLAVAGIIENLRVRAESRVLTTAVDGVLDAAQIESLPLNGRNFLELALLVPGNALTPLFDPTKSNRVLIGSAGQLGRGGNITIDGQDNNDDVVGGPLLNLPIDAVQEFQIATSRFGADQGRSASSAINVITRSGTTERHGSASIFARDDAWQALPSTLDDPDLAPPFDRQQMSGAFGGPLWRDRLFWFAAGELRHQNGGVLVGTRNTAARTITTSFAPAPLRDSLWSLRLDTAGSGNRLSVRYAGEWGTDTSASAIERAIGSATQRQEATNRYHNVLGTWTSAPSNSFVNALSASVSTFLNETLPVATAPQLTFPSLQDGASFRMPQRTTQTRLQVSDSATFIRGPHSLRVGGELHQIYGEFNLGVFQQGRIELVQDFPTFDHTGDGRIDDNDLLFAVTLRSGKPTQALDLPDSNNTHIAGFAQDDWRVSNRLQVNVGLRYEIDTEVNNQSRVDELNPIVQPFVHGARQRDLNNLAPRVGFAWNVGEEALLVRGGYGIYYDRIVLQIQSLERGLDGRALPIEVRAGNVFFVDPAIGRLPPFAPTLANPFTGFILPGAGASGINIIDPHLQNPMVHEFHLGVERTIVGTRARVDALHSAGRHFLIGRTVGEVFNPVVGGPDRVVNIESSAKTKYDALLVSANRAFTDGYSFQIAYTLARAFNYANDDQIPFLGGPIDPNDLAREYGPTPHDRRDRFVASGQVMLPGRVSVSAIWTVSSGVPMDILMPDGQSRIPVLQRNAGGRLFHTPAELNAFITSVNAGGGIDGEPLPLVSSDARFNDSFNSLDFRISRSFALNQSRIRIEPLVEVFNLFNATNILGVSNVNYSGFSNVLVRDSETPGSPGYLRSSGFGRPVTTAGGVFGSGGPRAMQIGARVTF
jgi:Carboxypeptidase regulatory-like domain/TonB dependent receptor